MENTIIFFVFFVIIFFIFLLGFGVGIFLLYSSLTKKENIKIEKFLSPVWGQGKIFKFKLFIIGICWIIGFILILIGIISKIVSN